MATNADNQTVKPDRNSLGKASFVIGLTGLILSFIPIIGFVSWLLAPLAILFGLIALSRPSRSLAIAGIITGALALFICFSWIRATQSVGEAMSADTFNPTGKAVDTSSAPVVEASVKGVWSDLEDNKVAAGKKYGGRRLSFTNETVHEIDGDAENPRLRFVGKTDEFLLHLVSASFSARDADRIGELKKGEKVSFVCTGVGETFGDGYSLSGCTLS